MRSLPSDDAWLPAAALWAGGPVTVAGRTPLSGGYVADAVVRVDLDAGGRACAVVVQSTTATEVAARRALAVVRGVDRPRLLAAGPDWTVVPFYAGPALSDGPDVPAELWTLLARVHAHWLGRRPRGVPVADAAWWRTLCTDRVRPHLMAAHSRTADPRFDAAATAVTAWAADPRLLTALAVLPRTLVHADLHRGNVLLSDAGPVPIDWGNALVAAPGLDLPVLHAQGAVDDSTYRRAFAELAGEPTPELLAVETAWAQVRAHVAYMGFAADHLGAARVAELVDGAALALDALGPALAAFSAAAVARPTRR